MILNLSLAFQVCWGYPGLAQVGVLGSDDGDWSWFLLIRFLHLPFPIWYSLELVVIVVSGLSLFFL